MRKELDMVEKEEKVNLKDPFREIPIILFRDLRLVSGAIKPWSKFSLIINFFSLA